MSLNIYHLTKLVDKAQRCKPVETFVHKECIFKYDPLRSLQPMELMQERSDVMKLGRRKDKPISCVHHWLELWRMMRCKAGQCRIAVVKLREWDTIPATGWNVLLLCHATNLVFAWLNASMLQPHAIHADIMIYALAAQPTSTISTSQWADNSVNIKKLLSIQYCDNSTCYYPSGWPPIIYTNYILYS